MDGGFCAYLHGPNNLFNNECVPRKVKMNFKVGDVVKNSHNRKKGTIVFIHPKDEVRYVVDFGKEWAGCYEDELKRVKIKEEL